MSAVVTDRFTRVAILLHWLIALLIIINILLGLTAAWSDGDAHRWALDLHKPTGITILALSIARIAWRIGHRPPPALPAPAWQHRVTTVTHAPFYFLIVAMPLTGTAVPLELREGEIRLCGDFAPGLLRTLKRSGNAAIARSSIDGPAARREKPKGDVEACSSAV